jgi:hypothetical protein
LGDRSGGGAYYVLEQKVWRARAMSGDQVEDPLWSRKMGTAAGA